MKGRRLAVRRTPRNRWHQRQAQASASLAEPFFALAHPESTGPAQRQIAASGASEIAASGASEIASSGVSEIAASGVSEIAASGAFEIASSGASEIASSGAFHVSVHF